MSKCPKCGAAAKEVDYAGAKVIVCDKCGYDGTEELDAVPEQRTSQKEKGRYSPYKTGGKSRAR